MKFKTTSGEVIELTEEQMEFAYIFHCLHEFSKTPKSSAMSIETENFALTVQKQDKVKVDNTIGFGSPAEPYSDDDEEEDEDEEYDEDEYQKIIERYVKWL